MTKGGPHLRVSSPPSGLSTLMTSAPRSASNCPAQGPARMRASSITRMPFSGGSAMDHRDGSKVQPLPIVTVAVTAHALGQLLRRLQHMVCPDGEIVHDDIAIDLVQAFVAGVGVNL